MVRLSAIYKVRDEEMFFPYSLKSVKPYVDEIIVVIDDSSVDATYGIALCNTNHLVEYHFNPLMSPIKYAMPLHLRNMWNVGLALATGDWVLFLDGDDVYSKGNMCRMREYLEKYHPIRNVITLEFLQYDFLDFETIRDYTIGTGYFGPLNRNLPGLRYLQNTIDGPLLFPPMMLPFRAIAGRGIALNEEAPKVGYQHIHTDVRVSHFGMCKNDFRHRQEKMAHWLSQACPNATWEELLQKAAQEPRVHLDMPKKPAPEGALPEVFAGVVLEDLQKSYWKKRGWIE